MNRCGFFDDEPPAGPLPRWATITQVSDFLDVSRHLVHSTVREAVENSESWVKKEIADTGKPTYLIDTDHETYKVHEEQWKRHHAMYGNASSDPFSYHRALWLEPDDMENGLDSWHSLRQWLSVEGIQIFKNILDEEGQTHPWRWRWGDLEGEGCLNVEEAIVMALQTRFHVYEEELSKQDAALFDRHPQEEPQRLQRFRFFARRKESSPFYRK